MSSTSTSLNPKVSRHTTGNIGGVTNTTSGGLGKASTPSSSINMPMNTGYSTLPPPPPPPPPSEKFVTDAHFSNSKQLLNAYVYDFLIKSSLPETAQSFIKEADVPTGHPTTKTIKRPPQKDLLPLAISLDAPQGFLYEWWQIFWDVFNARTHRGGSENAQHYYQLQLARQQREIALHNSTLQAAHQQQLQLQQMNQQQLQYQQQQQQQMGQSSALNPVPMIPINPGQVQVVGQLPNGDSFPAQMYPTAAIPGNVTVVPQGSNTQQFIMSQQWLQQQQKQLAATMTNGGRQPMAMNPQQQGTLGSSSGAQNDYFQQQLMRGTEEVNGNKSSQTQVQYQMNQLRQQQMQQQHITVPADSPSKKQKIDDIKSSNKQTPEEKEVETGSGSSALQDYQLQLMLLERENKKMLTNKSKDSSNPNSSSNTPNATTSTSTKNGKKETTSPFMNNKMPPQPSTSRTKGSTPSASPLTVANGGSPVTTTGTADSRKKKESIRIARGKKKDVSNPPTPMTPLTPSQIVNGATNSINNNNTSNNNNNNNNSKREPTTSTIMEENGEDSLNVDPVRFSNNHLPHHHHRLNQHTINPADVSPSSLQLTPPTSDSHKTAAAITTTTATVKPESALSHFEMSREDSDPSIGVGLRNSIVENFGSQMLSNGKIDSDNEDVQEEVDAFGGFGSLSDFQNDLNNDNFNLENFLNQDHDDGDGDHRVGEGFESYWRDTVGGEE